MIPFLPNMSQVSWDQRFNNLVGMLVTRWTSTQTWHLLYAAFQIAISTWECRPAWRVAFEHVVSCGQSFKPMDDHGPRKRVTSGSLSTVVGNRLLFWDVLSIYSYTFVNGLGLQSAYTYAYLAVVTATCVVTFCAFRPSEGFLAPNFIKVAKAINLLRRVHWIPMILWETLLQPIQSLNNPKH